MLVLMCGNCGLLKQKEARQVERNETCIYACRHCGQTCDEYDDFELVRQIEAKFGKGYYSNPSEFFEVAEKLIREG